MAFAVDSTATFDSGATSASSHSFNHTVSSNTNGVLIVNLIVTNNRTVTGVTYNGVAMTAVTQEVDSSYWHVEQWKLLAPSTGTHAIVISLSGSGFCQASSIAFTGAATSPIGGTASNNAGTGTTASVSLNSIYQKSFLVDCTLVNHNSGGLTKGSPQTTLFVNYNSTDGFNIGSTYESVGFGVQEFTYTFATGDSWRSLILQVLPFVTLDTIGIDTTTGQLRSIKSGDVSFV